MAYVKCSSFYNFYRFTAVFEGSDITKGCPSGLPALMSPSVNTPDFVCHIKYTPQTSTCEMHGSAKNRPTVNFSLQASICDERSGRRTSFERSPVYIFVATTTFFQVAVLPAEFHTSKRLIFDFEVTVYCEPTKSENIELAPSNIQSKLADPLQAEGAYSTGADIKAYQQATSSKDAKLLVNGDIVAQAHKSVLSIRSEVFRTMFASQMSEALTGEVNMLDVAAGAVMSFGNYMYTDSVGGKEMQQYSIDLYIMARKYHVIGLEILSETFMIANLDAPNVIQILQLSNLHDANTLHSAAISYIRRNNKSLVQNEDFCKRYHQYVNELNARAIEDTNSVCDEASKTVAAATEIVVSHSQTCVSLRELLVALVGETT